MQHKPEQQNKGVNYIFAAILVFGAITYAIPVIFASNGAKISAFPFTAMTLMAIVAAVFLMIRYRMTQYTYVIRLREDDTNGEEYGLERAHYGIKITDLNPQMLDFCVYRAQGTRLSSMECLFSLDDLVDAKLVSMRTKSKNAGKNLPTREEIRKKYAERGGILVYDYTLTLGLDEALELVFVDGNRYAGIIIEADEIMQGYLLSLKK